MTYIAEQMVANLYGHSFEVYSEWSLIQNFRFLRQPWMDLPAEYSISIIASQLS